ncbi:GNAT family N-acetyltransferase [Paenibacillus eucommiae]|uniref:GNAT family N-acetyltransferase n=1 Tax=Paenibacillus eucommiae TaxID=1355755 RepID=A0ABS4J8P7_9BACL|nr:GNAT family N-acetyltransferase [Paenibacillus eucommiae]MBP1995441.1 hypothetical protein [Paenibacillus eucommiae]
MYDELELMNMQAEVLYTHDALGKITKINDSEEQPAPRLFWGKTNKGNVIRFRPDVPKAMMNQLAEIINNSDVTNLAVAKIINKLEQHAKISSLWIGPAYVFVDHSFAGSKAVKVTDDNRQFLEAGFENVWSTIEHREPCYMVIEDNKAVSVCYCARNTDRAAEAGVETLEEYRGKGYALAVASAWSAAIHESKRIALYSTSWDNYASQAVAKRLQLNLYGSDLSIY